MRDHNFKHYFRMLQDPTIDLRLRGKAADFCADHYRKVIPGGARVMAEVARIVREAGTVERTSLARRPR